MSLPGSSSLSSTQKLWVIIFFLVIACLIFAGPLTDIVDGLIAGESLEDLLVAYGYAPPPTPTPTPIPPPTLQVGVTACLDGNDLTIAIQFDRPVTGEAHLQVFSSGGSDFLTQPDATGFQQRTNNFNKTENITAAIARWEIVIPTSSNPVGIGISGTFVLFPLVGEAPNSAWVEFSMEVLECNPTEILPPTETPTPTPNPDGTPAIINSICVSNTQLMIVFEFQQPVTGLYEVFVNGIPYQLTPVPDQPDRQFFIGAAPPGGGMPTIVLQSLPDHALVLEVADYSVPQCDFESPNNPNPGGDYVPPP